MQSYKILYISFFKNDTRKENMVTYSMFTNQGERDKNEDSIGHVQNAFREVFLLADGLGGHGFGDVASQLIVSSMEEKILHYDKKPIKECIMDSQWELLEEQKLRHAEEKMKTTLACLTIERDYAQFWHIGDSRIYWFHNNHYKMRTLDHSVPQMLVRNGILKEKEIRKHPDRNRLLKVMGVAWDSPKYEESQRIELKGKEAFLLCSDGFWEWIEEKKMEKYLKSSVAPEEWIGRMTEEILSKGKGNNMDNFSAIAVFVCKDPNVQKIQKYSIGKGIWSWKKG